MQTIAEMAEKERDKAFAFPFMLSDGEHFMACTGLTKRELFAAMAMQGLLMAPLSDWAGDSSSEIAKYKGIPASQFFAIQSVGYADALLAELAKEQP